MTNTNTPQQPVPTSGEIPGGMAPQLPGPALPQTTKPRQIPGGGGMGTVPGGSGMGETPGPAMGFDPASNGASTLPGAETLGTPPVTSDTMANPTVTNDTVGNVNPRVSAIATEILQHNPGLPRVEAHRLASLAFARYLTREPGWEHNPLAVVAARDLDPEPPPPEPVLGVVHAEDSLWDRMTGGHETPVGGPR